ncbi:MAG TPA: TrmH family RNA methyltransferase [Trueperaceae bacterium]|nr:TrmH family RNA methyltransferase [Trueperaceae bacterium]
MAERPLPYRSELPYTYAFGHFAAIEALTHRPQAVQALFAHGGLAPQWRTALRAVAERAGVNIVWDDATVTRLRRHAQVACIAQVAKSAEVADPDKDHVVLIAPSHAGNVGSAIRSLVAFGFTDLVLVAPRVDAWGPHVIRASVGLRFALRCQIVASAAEYLLDHPGRRHYSFSAGATAELRDVGFEHPLALWFGPEWAPDGALETAPPTATPVSIAVLPHVESLNLATAVSLAAYHARR